MPIALVVVATVLAHTAFNGSRLAISLYTLALGGSALTVGILLSISAALPMMLGVAAGRLVDRVGVRQPALIAAAMLTVSVMLPGTFPGIAALYFTAGGAGVSFLFFHIAVQHAVGETDDPNRRKANFGWLMLGFSISNFIGPIFAGTMIDAVGHPRAFLLLSLFALAALVLLGWRRHDLMHRPERPDGRRSGRTRELLADPELRRVLIATALLASAWDLFVFVMPIHGTAIGLSASTIGFILGSFATATIVVRLALPFLSRHLREWPIITATLFIACVAYALLPLVDTVPLLAAIAFLLGLGLGAVAPSILSLIYATAPEGRAAEAVGVRSVVLNASHAALPLAFGGLGAALGMLPVFWSMAVALAAGGWFADRRRRTGPAP